MQTTSLYYFQCCTCNKLSGEQGSQVNLPSVEQAIQLLEVAEVVFAGWDFYDDIQYADALSNEHWLNVSSADQDLG